MRPRFVTITCPSCGERFEIAAPPAEELPAELDYDCEICCRPMVIRVEEDDGGVTASAHGPGE